MAAKALGTGSCYQGKRNQKERSPRQPCRNYARQLCFVSRRRAAQGRLHPNKASVLFLSLWLWRTSFFPLPSKDGFELHTALGPHSTGLRFWGMRERDVKEFTAPVLFTEKQGGRKFTTPSTQGSRQQAGLLHPKCSRDCSKSQSPPRWECNHISILLG